MSRRGVAGALGFAAVLVGAFVALDRFGGERHFADLPGGADVRLVGRFTTKQVERLAALPEAAAVECDDTYYDVGLATTHGVFPQSTVLTAVRSPALQRAAIVQGRAPATDGEVLAVDRRGLKLGDRVTFTRGSGSLAGTVVGVAARPSGQPDAMAMLTAGAMTKLNGGTGCGELAVQLRKRSQATAFQRGAKDVLGPGAAVTYDDSLRGHV